MATRRQAGDAWAGALAVIGAGSVITKDVEPLTKVAGVPARVIGVRDKGFRLGQEIDSVTSNPRTG
jgi:serine acetyltransferase